MKRSAFGLPAIARLAMASWETIYHRSMLMAQGTCSAAEYQRMLSEKITAMQISTLALMTGKSQADVMAPYLSRARANAKRLRTKK
jgi:hypothetical protein